MANIMIVDDDPLIRKWVEKCLDPLEHETISVSSGEEFRNYFDSGIENIDIVLMDILLPDLDGIEATRLLKSLEQPPIVIMLTSLTDSRSMKNSANAGADDFLVKPVRANDLHGRINQALQAKSFFENREMMRREQEEKMRRYTKSLDMIRKENSKLHSELIAKLDRLTDLRDVETYEHTVRVGMLSRMIAERLGLPEEYQERIASSAVLHDLGKTGIPDSILLKSGRLTHEEWKTMKTHTTLGWEILKDSSDKVMKMAAEICLSHHERWDGTGYPEGLVKENIPLSGQIVSVADSYDAIVSSRPYKRPIAYNDGFEEIKRCSGTQFSPVVVYAFLGLRKEVLDLYSSDFAGRVAISGKNSVFDKTQ